MTDLLVDQLQSRLELDRFDLAKLADTGMLRFRLGDQDFELRTGPRPDDRPYSIRLEAKHLESLRCDAAVKFRRPWGTLTVALAEGVAR